MQKKILLEVKNLSVHFYIPAGSVKAVQNVSFAIEKGKTFALVGESGCGKSTTALAILQLVSVPPGPRGLLRKPAAGVSGSVLLDGQDLTKLSEKKMRDIRGNKIAIVFQEPMTSLNPVYMVGNQIAEAIKLHQRKNARQVRRSSVESPRGQIPREMARPTWADAIDTLRKVSIADPKQIAKMYPHQLSGGMQQRVMIAMAVSCKPALLIADEPTTALDVTIQAQILDLLEQLQRQTGMSILLITHDLGVVAERADNIAVMYASRIVEMADSRQLFAEPFHPYTQGLLRSLPRLGVSAPARDGQAHKRLPTIPGTVPEPLHFSILRSGSGQAGCKFHPRCPTGCADERCQTIEPELREVQPGRYVACWYAPGYEKG